MRIVFILYLALIGVTMSCQEKNRIHETDTFLEENKVLNNEGKVKIDLININKVFGEATTDFYVENHYAFRYEDTINTILDSVGLVFYRDIFNKLIHDIYIPLGCSWADIQIKQNEKKINIRYGDESGKSIIGCEIKYTAGDILEFSENQTIIYDCHNNKGKMSFKKKHLLVNGMDIDIDLMFTVRN